MLKKTPKGFYMKKEIALLVIITSFLFLFTPLSSYSTAKYNNTSSLVSESTKLDSNNSTTEQHHPSSNSNSITNSRVQNFRNGDVLQYLYSIVQPYFQYSRMSYFAAILIFLLYLFYFRYIDIYESEPWKYILITFFGGILFADLGLVLYDFTFVVVGWSMNDNFINDLFYTVFIIGGIEELVKILPLIIILRFTKIINEPIDYIVYGGVAALGFAFSENVMYFDRLGAGIIFGRALTAVALHTSLTGIVAYGFVLRDYKNKKYAPLKLYFIAILLHGLYDFFLINPTARSLMILAYFILFAGVNIFNNIISNSLSNSPYYKKSIHLKVRKIQFLLVGGLLGILLLQFIFLGLDNSWGAAIKSIRSSAIAAIILIPALVIGFGDIKLHPKSWKSLKLPFLFSKIVIDEENNNLINTHLQFAPMTRNKIMLDYFPNLGQVYNQSYDSKKQLWFYIRLEKLAHQPEFNNKHILIRSKFDNDLLNENDGLGMAGVYLIKNTTKKPVFIGWVSVEENT